MRAVVRRRIGQVGEVFQVGQVGHSVTDALGDLVAIDADSVTVRTRQGLEVIARADVVAAKEVPPKPVRRGAPHLAVSMNDLERVMVEGWPPLERAVLGGWLLRAGAGFTGRANSVLPLGDPGVSLPAAVDHCQRWYDERGLRRMFALFGPEGFGVEEDPLGRELLSRGYEPFNSTLVLTAAVRGLAAEVPGSSGHHVLLEPNPAQGWWDAWADQHGRGDHTGPESAPVRALMEGSADQLFASVEVDGAVVGIARIAFAQGWAGVFALGVRPEHRRRGVGMQLMGALADACRSRGIRSMYLQVLKTSSPALELYESLGFSTHHEYCYLGA
jgi:ribosomal protein S18 acetylase RimI-like enzyme